MNKWFIWFVIALFSPASYSVDQTKPTSQLADQVLLRVNQYRAKKGLPKLVMNQALCDEATQHSLNMAKHVVPFGHDGFQQRIKRLQAMIPMSSTGAENVAYNYKTADIVVDGWVHSPGHRRNIVGHYDLTGIGIVYDEQGKPYFTQIFLRTHHAKKASVQRKLYWL